METLDFLISKHCKASFFNGVVLIADKDNIVYWKSFGYDDINSKTVLDKRAVFRIGSITKQLTAVAVLKLIEAGKCALSDTIDQYIDNVPYKEPISLHHLLSNCSGIPNFNPFADYSLYLKSSEFQQELIHEVIFAKPLNFKPGSQFEYSSSGYFILSYIIEKISGLAYSKFLSENIFKPLAMLNSGFCFSDITVSGLASLYDVKNGEIVPAVAIDMRLAGGGGGLYACALDLYRWNKALLTDQLISAEHRAMMFTVQTPINDRGGYGYGVISVKDKREKGEHWLVYHPGNGPGVYAMNTLIDQRLQLIMLSNINDRETFMTNYTYVLDLLLDSDNPSA